MATDELEAIIETATAADRALDHAMQPANSNDIAEMLLGFVEMLNVLEPGERGLLLYEAALGPLPLCLYPKAAMIVARTHRWRSLPTPADFFHAVRGELMFIETQRLMIRNAIDGPRTTLNNRDHQRRMFG